MLDSKKRKAKSNISCLITRTAQNTVHTRVLHLDGFIIFLLQSIWFDENNQRAIISEVFPPTSYSQRKVGGGKAGSVQEKSELRHLCLDEVTDVVLGRIQFGVPHTPPKEEDSHSHSPEGLSFLLNGKEGSSHRRAVGAAVGVYTLLRSSVWLLEPLHHLHQWFH